MVHLCAHGDLTVMMMMSFMAVSARQVSRRCFEEASVLFLTQDSHTNIMQHQSANIFITSLSFP